MSGRDQHWLEVREHHSYYVLREDVRIALAIGMDGYHGGRDLSFPWAAWPDESVRGIFADVLYGGQPVHRAQLLSVDGGRAYLPTPRPRTEGKGRDLRIVAEEATADEVSFARLCDRLVGRGDFARYFEESTITEVPALPSW